MDPERMKQERLSIVNKYFKGPEADEGTWNAYSYDDTDQYGFLLNINNQYSCKAEPTTISKHREGRWRAAEIKRRTKWLKMVRHWDKYVGTEKLTKRVYKGIPPGMRGDVWRLLLEVYKYLENTPNMYQEMKSLAHGHSDDIRQIDLDVNRTYRDHVMFHQRYSIKQQQLFHVLAAYSMYNTEVGYCQGMSQIAALLLMYMDEEEAFWAMHSLLYGKKHKMHGFFIPGFPKLMRFQQHHDKILAKLLPKLKKHLDENEVYASLYTMKWFFQCFLDRTPFSLTLRLWDIYILEGEKLLTAMSYATLKMHKNYIKKQEMDGIISLLQEELVRDFGATDDAVVDYLKTCMTDLARSGLDLAPDPSEAEKPKLTFGNFSVNTEKSALTNIPEFAKHSVNISALTQELRTAQKKKEAEAKSRESTNALTHNTTQLRNQSPSTKETKSHKNTEHLNRTFVRGSLKKLSKNEKRKRTKETPHSKGVTNKELERKLISQKGKDQNDDGKENNFQGTSINRMPIGEKNQEVAEELMNKELASERAPKDQIHLTTSTNPKASTAKATQFVPPILARDVSFNHAASSVERTLPISEKISTSTVDFRWHAVDPRSNILPQRNIDRIDSANGTVKSGRGDGLNTLPRNDRTKLQSPSFFQLSSMIDSIEDESQNSPPNVDGSLSGLLIHDSREQRRQSVYDNVPSTPFDHSDGRSFPNHHRLMPEVGGPTRP